MEAEGDVLGDGHMLEQRVVLEHEADPPLLHGKARRVQRVKEHGAAMGRVEAGDDAQQRRLARARRTEQRDELARRNVERDVAQRRIGAEIELDPLNADLYAAL